MAKTTFNFHPDTSATLKELQQHFKTASKAEVLRKAIALLEMAQEARERGGEMAVVDKDGNVHKVLM